MEASTGITPNTAIVTQYGEAIGRLNGFNHVVLVCSDMDRSVRFYRDILGLKVVRTAPKRRGYEKQYFFELANGELFSLYQMSNIVTPPERPVVNKLWPELDGTPPEHPQKMDHLAFNVDTLEELEWFRAHLERSGVVVSDMVGPPSGDGFLQGRIYFEDPDRNPLEVATMDAPNREGLATDRDSWYQDDDPVPSVRAE